MPFLALRVRAHPKVPVDLAAPLDVGHIHRRDELEQERAHVQDVVHDLQAFRRMPTDVMAEIFEHCADPLLLAQVCRAWRRLLFALPCLWTSLLVRSATDWEARCMAIHLWFSRSNALPVSLSLHHHRGPAVPRHALMLLDREILSLAPRLRRLSLHFASRSLASLLTFTQSPLPHLHHLELRNTNTLPTSDDPPPVVLHSAPSLQSLSISSGCLDLRNFVVPWSQLLHLDLEYNAVPHWDPIHSDYLLILALCPNLSSLSLGLAAPIIDVDPATPAQPVTLPRLRSFQVSIFVQTPYLAWLFDALRLPQLRRFEIKNVSLGLGSFAGHTQSLPLLARCADTLESLSFDQVDIPDGAVMSCLGQLDRLKSLSVLPGVLRLNHGLARALAHEDTADQRVCPALEALHLRCSPAVPIDAVVRLVASRSPKLKQFSLQLASFGYGEDKRDDKIKEVQTLLKEFVEDGLDLDLSKRNSNSTY